MFDRVMCRLIWIWASLACQTRKDKNCGITCGFHICRGPREVVRDDGRAVKLGGSLSAEWSDCTRKREEVRIPSSFCLGTRSGWKKEVGMRNGWFRNPVLRQDSAKPHFRHESPVTARKDPIRNSWRLSMDCNRVGDGTGVDFKKVEAAFGWWMGTGYGYRMLLNEGPEACGRGQSRYIQKGMSSPSPLCPSPAPYSLNSPNTPSFAW